MVRFGAVTQEKLLLIFCTSVKKMQKLAYPADQLRTSSTDLDQILNFNRHMGGGWLICRSFWDHLRDVAMVTNKLGGFCKRRIWPPPIFALAFWKGMQYRHLHKGINTGDNAATSCKNLVNFGAVTAEIISLICVPLCGYWANCRAGISRHVRRLKCRWARLKQRWTCTSQ